LLAWAVQNADTLFQGVVPEYWGGNFGPGFRYWEKYPSFWSKLTD